MKLIIIIIIIIIINIIIINNIKSQYIYDDFGLINKIFKNKQYGADPGPCANENEKCYGDAQSIPDFLNVYVNVVTIGFVSFGCKLKDCVTDGDFYLWDLQCSDISLTNLEFNEDKVYSSTSTESEFNIEGAKVSCTGKFEVIDMEINNGEILFINIPLIDTSGEFIVEASKQENGNNIQFGLDLKTDSGEDFTSSIPHEVQQDDNDCDILLNLGLSLKDMNLNNLNIPNWVQPLVELIIEAVLEGMIAATTCETLLQNDYLKDSNGNDIEPGVLNVLLNHANDYLDGLQDADNIDIDQQEIDAINYVGSIIANNAWNIQDSDFVQLVSVTINDWLAATNDQGNLVINEMIDVLLYPETNGNVKFTENSLKDVIDIVTIETAAVIIDIELLDFEVGGLNTFSSFDALDNDYSTKAVNDRYKHTLKHKVVLDSLFLGVKVTITFNDGEWVKPNNEDPVDFSFRYQVGINDIDIDLATLFIITLDDLQKLSLGQIVGETENALLDKVTASLSCLAPAIHTLNLTNFQFSIGEIVDPTLSDFPDQGLETFINDIVKLLTHTTKGALHIELPKILQHTIRPSINDILWKYAVIGDGSECPEPVPYVPDPDSPYIDFGNNFAFNLTLQFINKVVGGDPIQDSSVDINELIQIILESFFFEPNEFYGQGGRVTSPNYGEWIFKPDAEFYTGNDFVFDLEQLKITGLHTIDTLELAAVGKHDALIHIGMFGGSLAEVGSQTRTIPQDNFIFSMVFTLTASTSTISESNNGLNERYELSLELSQVEVDVLFNLLLKEEALRQLDQDTILITACILAVVDGLFFNEATITAGYTKIFIENMLGSTTNLGNAITALENALIADGGENNQQIGYMLDYILQSSFNNLVRTINNYNHTSANELSIDECTTEESGGLLNVLNNLPNITQTLNELLGGDIEDANWTPKQFDETVILINALGKDEPNYFDWDDYELGSYIQTIIDTSSNVDLAKILDDLADSNGDFFSDLFERELNNDIALIIPVEDYMNSISLDGFIDDGYIIIKEVKWTGVNAIDYDTLKILNPLSDFTQNTYIKIAGETYLEFQIAIQVPETFLQGPNTNQNIHYTDIITIRLTATDIVIDMNTIIGINLDNLSRLTLGHFLSIDEFQDFYISPNAMDCFLDQFYENGLSLGKLILDVNTASILPSVLVTTETNFILSNEVNDVIKELLNIFIELFANDLPNVTNGLIRTLIIEYLIIPKRAESVECLDPEPIPDNILYGDDILINWKTSNAGDFLRSIHQQLIGPDKDYQPVNEILDSSFNGKSYFDKNHFDGNFTMAYHGVYFGDIKYDIGPITFKKGMDTIIELSPFLPKTNTILSANATFDGPLVIEIIARFGIDGFFINGFNSLDEVVIEISVSDFLFALDLLIDINIPRFLQDLEVGSTYNTSEASCIASTFDLLQIESANFGIGDFNIIIECVGTCNSPLAENIAAGNSIVVSGGGEGGDVLGYLEAGVSLVETYLTSKQFNNLIENYVKESNQTCAEVQGLYQLIKDILHPSINEGFDVSRIFGWSFLGCFILSSGYFFILIKKHRSRYGEIMELVGKDKARQQLMELEIIPFFQHPAIPASIRYGLPIVFFISSIALVLSWLIMAAFSIDNIFIIGGSISRRLVLVEFTVPSLINDVWNSGTYPLALILAAASCAFPVLKNIILLFCWLAPSTILPRYYRYHLFDIFDTLGRWSFADVFVIIIIAATLRMYVDVSYNSFLSFLPEGLLVIETNVTPRPGYIVLTAAAAIALGATHFVTYYNLKCKEYDENCLLKAAGVTRDEDLLKLKQMKAKISNHVFVSSEPYLPYASRYTKQVKVLIQVAIGFTLITLFIAMTVPIATFKTDGVLGVVVGLIDEERFSSKTYSYFTFGRAMEGARETGSRSNDILNVIAILFYEILFYICVIIAPFLQIIGYGVLFFYPLNKREAEIVKFVTNICGSWACLEVMLVAVLLTLLQVDDINQYVVDFITDGRCSNAEDLLTSILGSIDGGCLKTRSYFEPYVVLTVFGITCQLLLASFMQRVCGVAMKDRELSTREDILLINKDGTRVNIKHGFVERYITNLTINKNNNNISPNDSNLGLTITNKNIPIHLQKHINNKNIPIHLQKHINNNNNYNMENINPHEQITNNDIVNSPPISLNNQNRFSVDV